METGVTTSVTKDIGCHQSLLIINNPESLDI